MTCTKNNHCVDCGALIWSSSVRCSVCAMKHAWEDGKFDDSDFSGASMEDTGNHCVDCGTLIAPRSTRCRSCAIKHKWAQGDYDGNDFGADKKRQPKLYICPDCGGPKSRPAERCASCARKRMWQDPGYYQAQVDRMREAWENGNFDKSQKKAIESARKFWSSERSKEERHRRSEQWRQMWQDGTLEMNDEWATKIMEGCHSPTSIEIALSNELDKRGLDHIGQYSPDDCPYTYDEFIKPDTLLEANGDYWHGPDFPKNQQRDKLREAWAIEHGYRFAVVWEHEINDWGVEDALTHSLNERRSDD